MSMLRPLKHHEKPFLKKTDYLVWKKSLNVREIKVIRRYHLQDREDYSRLVYDKKIESIIMRNTSVEKCLIVSSPGTIS